MGQKLAKYSQRQAWKSTTARMSALQPKVTERPHISDPYTLLTYRCSDIFLRLQLNCMNPLHLEENITHIN